MHDHEGVDAEMLQARLIRDSMFEFVSKHERDFHEGEPCNTVRVGLLAFLAHSMGVTTPLAVEAFPLFLQILGDYEKAHRAPSNGNGHRG